MVSLECWRTVSSCSEQFCLTWFLKTQPRPVGAKVRPNQRNINAETSYVSDLLGCDVISIHEKARPID